MNFLSFFSTIVGRYAKTRVHSCYRLPWYTQGLKIYTNLGNKFYKRYIESGDAADFDRYKQRKREFEFLNKFLYSQYIANIERILITNPKSIWHFVNSKRTTSYFPFHMPYVRASSDIGVANLFASIRRLEWSAEVNFWDKKRSSGLRAGDPWFESSTLACNGCNANMSVRPFELTLLRLVSIYVHVRVKEAHRYTERPCNLSLKRFCFFRREISLWYTDCCMSWRWDVDYFLFVYDPVS